jgi:hypothetical protein
MGSAPERVWLDWPGANKGEPVYDEPPERVTHAGQIGYLRADIAAAREAELRAEVERLKSERLYIIGWNDGWQECESQMKAEAARLRAMLDEVQETALDVAASLSAAISLLERGGKAAKKAAPSDRMFDIMLNDYRTSLEKARAALGHIAGEGE